MVTYVYKVLCVLLLLCAFSNCKVTKIPHAKQFDASDYIFKGEVVQTKKSNLPVVPDDQNTHIVKVNDIILASSGHESFKGENITVVAADDKIPTLKEGAGYVFYTHTWLFGSTLAVRANHVEPMTDKPDGIKDELPLYRDSVKKVNLQKRLKSSGLVMFGRVSKINEADVQRPSKESEHSPIWNIAIVEVENILKGNTEGNQVQVYFSASDDVRWVNAPKLKEEQKAIYLLKRTDSFMGIKNAYVLIDPQDVLPESELNLVKKLLKK
ncbi:hypothetical protein [Saccharicrinis sp. 156]|uniref:hypothetical protein n=1 Tax=Saccharicrinis sp. 156 TaxID=3417574 RepID=UPI003D33EEC3